MTKKWVKEINIAENDLTNRGQHRCSIKKGVLRNFVKFTGKHLHQSLFFNKVAGLRCATLLKNRLWHRCFPVNFIKLLKIPFLKNTSGRLLLTLKCIYEKKQPSRNHVEIMFVFEIFHEEDQILPRKWHLEAFTWSCTMKKTFISMKTLKKSTAPEFF